MLSSRLDAGQDLSAAKVPLLCHAGTYRQFGYISFSNSLISRVTSGGISNDSLGRGFANSTSLYTAVQELVQDFKQSLKLHQ